VALKKALTVLGLLSVSAWSFELEVGGGPQYEQFAGWVQYKGDKVDLKKDLNIKDRTRYFFYLDFRHKASLIFIPLPDVRVEYLRMNSSGTGTVSKGFTFGILHVNAGEKVHTKFKFHQLDTTFYYTPLDLKVVKASWGLGIKLIDFKASVTRLLTRQTETRSATVPLPYLYGRVGAYLPYIHIYGDIKGLTAGSKNYFYDWKVAAGLHYDITKLLRVSLDGGYRYQRYRVDDIDDTSADVRSKGAFGSLSLTLTF